jgi:hypothetical protein
MKNLVGGVVDFISYWAVDHLFEHSYRAIDNIKLLRRKFNSSTFG